MRNFWSDADAEATVARYRGEGIGAEVALRVYTTRLLGGDPGLVLHGGGNTSVKTRARDLSGDEVEVLCVKGSGWDMGSIEPSGLPAARLEPLRQLRLREAMSDDDMLLAQRANLVDPTGPSLSVETLLHAFLAHKYVDHTHANAVLALTDQPDGEELCRDLYGRRMALVPYVMPGFGLAKTAHEVFQAEPEAEGLILMKHGIVTFAETAKEAYERMIEMVTLAEKRVAAAVTEPFVQVSLPDDVATAAEMAPILRGLAALPEVGRKGRFKRFVLDHRSNPEVMRFVDGADLERYSRRGPVTPDHVIRTKPWPLVVRLPRRSGLDGFTEAAKAAVASYAADYSAYFERHNAGRADRKATLDPAPRVILVPGVGLFGLGRSAKEARIAADIAQTSVRVISAAEGLGGFESISEADIFDVEYWSLEQAKLDEAKDLPLAGQVAAITGAASGIGRATAAALRAAGAEVALLDNDADGAARVARELGGLGVACDVTDGTRVSAAFEEVVEAFGGVDVLVSNAGAAWQGRIGEVAEEVLRQSFELNFYGHQRAAQAAVKVMRLQGTGGVLLFNTSKQAINPGRDFGPYGLPKAATLFLMRQYAVDHGADGIRANAVNADRIRSGLLTDAMIAERAEARGLSEENYMAGNLLGREVTADDVAQAFLGLALAESTTGAVLTVDGGNIAAALR